MNSAAATDAFCYWLIYWLFSFSVCFNDRIDQKGIKKKDFFEKYKGLALFPKTSWKNNHETTTIKENGKENLNWTFLQSI